MSLLARPEVAVAAPLTGSLQVGLKIDFLFLQKLFEISPLSTNMIKNLTLFFQKYSSKVLIVSFPSECEQHAAADLNDRPGVHREVVRGCWQDTVGKV